MSVSAHSSRSNKLAPSTKDFDYMPSHRNGRQRHSFSVVSHLSKAQVLHVRQSPLIKPYITRSAKKGFKYNDDATSFLESRLYATTSTPAAEPLPPPGHSVSSPPFLAPSKPIIATMISSPPIPPLPSSPPLSSPPQPKSIPETSIEDDKFAYRCLRAVKLAVAAQVAIKTEETHIWARIKEEELVLGMLHDEAEDTGSRMKTASHQLKSIYDGAKLYGVALPDIEEIEQEVSQSQGQHDLPTVSPRTPPGTLFHELIVDVMNRSTRSLSQEPPELSSIASTSSMLFQVPPVHTVLDPPGPPQSTFNKQTLSQINHLYPASPPPSILPPQAGTSHREGKARVL